LGILFLSVFYFLLVIYSSNKNWVL